MTDWEREPDPTPFEDSETAKILRWNKRLRKLAEQRDAARRQAATYAAHIEDLSGQIDELRADLDRYKRDWLALLRQIAKLYDVVEDLDESEAWQHADDGTIWEQFDPWEALTVATAIVKAGREGAGPIANKTAPRIFKLQAECDKWRERALLARKAYHHAVERIEKLNEQLKDRRELVDSYELEIASVLETVQDAGVKRDPAYPPSGHVLELATRYEELRAEYNRLFGALQAAQNWARKESYQSDDYTEGYPPKGTCTWCLASPAEECWEDCPGALVAAALGNGHE